MSSALRPFNFYEDTGFFVPDVASFFTGLYVPPDVIKGGEQGFLWSSPESAPVPIGVSFAGDMDVPPPKDVFYRFMYGGSLFPVFREHAGIATSWGSGYLDSGTIDRPKVTLSWSGAIIDAIIPSIPFSYYARSGVVESGQADRFLSTMRYSGKLESGKAPIMTMGYSFFGKIYPVVFDSTSVQYAFKDVVYEVTKPVQRVSAESGISLGVQFNSVIYARV